MTGPFRSKLHIHYIRTSKSKRLLAKAGYFVCSPDPFRNDNTSSTKKDLNVFDNFQMLSGYRALVYLCCRIICSNELLFTPWLSKAKLQLQEQPLYFRIPQHKSNQLRKRYLYIIRPNSLWVQQPLLATFRMASFSRITLKELEQGDWQFENDWF